MKAKPYGSNPLSDKAFDKAMKAVEKAIAVRQKNSSNSLRTKSYSRHSDALVADFCVKCDKDTPHKHQTCLYCRTAKESAPLSKRTWFSHTGTLAGSEGVFDRPSNYQKRQRINVQRARDKKAYLHAQAEKSRAMFEPPESDADAPN